MRLRDDLPDLDEAELHRPWLTPEHLLDVAGLYTHTSASPQRKLLANAAQRGFIVGVPSGAGRTAPRLHTLATVTKFAFMARLVERGRSFEVGAAVGETAAALLRHLAMELPRWTDIDLPDRRWTIIYSCAGDGGLYSAANPPAARAFWVDSPSIVLADLEDFDWFEGGVIHAAPLLSRIVERYSLRLQATLEGGA